MNSRRCPPIRSPQSNPNPLSDAIQPDSMIVSSLEHLRSQSSSSSSSETPFDFDAASVSELVRIVLHDDQCRYDDDAVLADGTIVPSIGGAVSGRLVITNPKNGYRLDCSKLDGSGIIIPPDAYSVGNLESDALFILLVEHSDVYFRISREQFSDRLPCIVIVAEGQRHGATRDFLKRLKAELKIPVLALVNSDPHGLQILSFYVCGSLDIKWLGLRPSDLDKHQISEYCRLPMTDEDMKVGKDLLTKDFVKRNEGWVRELKMMLKTRQKAEVMALSSLGIQYLTEVYLPLKLQQQDWL